MSLDWDVFRSSCHWEKQKKRKKFFFHESSSFFFLVEKKSSQALDTWTLSSRIVPADAHGLSRGPSSLFSKILCWGVPHFGKNVKWIPYYIFMNKYFVNWLWTVLPLYLTPLLPPLPWFISDQALVRSSDRKTEDCSRTS